MEESREFTGHRVEISTANDIVTHNPSEGEMRAQEHREIIALGRKLRENAENTLKRILIGGEPTRMTWFGDVLDFNTQGVLYLCTYDYERKQNHPIRAIVFDKPSDALDAYANIPNPESMVAYRTKTATLADELQQLHKNFFDAEWNEFLAETL